MSQRERPTASYQQQLDGLQASILADLALLRSHLPPPSTPAGTEADDALTALESFVATAIRLMRKTNPSKVRDEARTTEIQARLGGAQVSHRPLHTPTQGTPQGARP